MSMSVVIADDHEVVRHGLRALLATQPEMDVVGEAGNGQQAIQVVIQTKPDVLVVDLALPDISGLAVIREVRRLSPETKIVVLSMHSSEPHVLEALRSGASAYVLKDTPSEELIEALRLVVIGQKYLSSALSQRAVEAYAQDQGAESNDLYHTLTRREKEILKLTVNGMSSDEIASALSLSRRTAQTHRANAMRKLDIRSQLDLIRYAMKRGLVLPES